MTEEASKLACFYVGFNGDFRGVGRLVLVAVECSVNRPTSFTRELAGIKAEIDHRHG